jgi:hypothetical protein
VNEEREMKPETTEKRFMPEVSRKEIDELKTTIKAASKLSPKIDA